jgi:hypothetical protein
MKQRIFSKSSKWRHGSARQVRACERDGRRGFLKIQIGFRNSVALVFDPFLSAHDFTQAV